MSMDIVKLKHIIENTDLFIMVSGDAINGEPRNGRAISIDLETGIVHFSRAAVLRIMGGEASFLGDWKQCNKMEFDAASFELIRDWSRQIGSWDRYRMEEFAGASWGELYDHIISVSSKKNSFLKAIKNFFLK